VWRGVVACTANRVAEHIVSGVDAGHPRSQALALLAVGSGSIRMVLTRQLSPASFDLLRRGVVADV
jgi:hypothetical protein